MVEDETDKTNNTIRIAITTNIFFRIEAPPEVLFPQEPTNSKQKNANGRHRAIPALALVSDHQLPLAL
jgi:hypothetical protein